MYSEEEIQSAIAAGVLSEESAAGLRAHVDELRGHVGELRGQAHARSSEESFRLISSFNDIFVAVGIVIVLVAAGAIAGVIAEWLVPSPEQPFGEDGLRTDVDLDAHYQAAIFSENLSGMLTGVCVALASWLLAEFFTRKRRMALPSILLLLSFVGAVFAAAFNLGGLLIVDREGAESAFLVTGAGAIMVLAAYLHWRRFMVPITVSAGTGAMALAVISLIVAVVGPDNINIEDVLLLLLVFAAGLAVFAFAMRWDMSDLTRTTRKSDVAFWLHLLAAPMIAHPIFALLGVFSGDDEMGIGGSIAVLAIYVLFGLVALAIDRRALLLAALAYVLAALSFLFTSFGAVELDFAFTALIAGSALLSLSAFWQPGRQFVVKRLPHGLQEKLPPIEESRQDAAQTS